MSLTTEVMVVRRMLLRSFLESSLAGWDFWNPHRKGETSALYSMPLFSSLKKKGPFNVRSGASRSSFSVITHRPSSTSAGGGGFLPFFATGCWLSTNSTSRILISPGCFTASLSPTMNMLQWFIATSTIALLHSRPSGAVSLLTSSSFRPNPRSRFSMSAKTEETAASLSLLLMTTPTRVVSSTSPKEALMTTLLSALDGGRCTSRIGNITAFKTGLSSRGMPL
mmetsp:Transcript_51626/g.160179  ORF Transcript_51626/g.160179 Transcript_51626/m.160179 type:complete len:224 (+) Transcript_51626:83-754(+)